MENRALPLYPLPAWARWAAGIWLVIWVPTYWHVWGPSSFFFLCDLAVLLACVGIVTGNALLISSQAVSSLVVDTAWLIDIVWKLLFGWHLIGGTEYFFDSHYPLAVRLMSMFHVALPFVLLMSLRRTGYDPRALRLQSAIAVAAMIASRLAGPQKNINFAFTDPFFRRSWGPAPIHLAVILAPLIVLIYVPTHFALKHFFRPPQTAHE
ncbi:MAG TPA: hypothetical protein VEJ39_08590 [Candidatus Acidoferrales bacterium]|nr:hypothetical protein [Candidatus Acidoferrales bacterium]